MHRTAFHHALFMALVAVPVQAQPAVEDAVLAEIERVEASQRRYGVAEAPQKTEGAVRLATYNVQNLFDAHDDPAYSGNAEDIDDTKPTHELIAVARAIHKLDADVLCLQEIESLGALTEFKELYLADMGYAYTVSIDAGGPRGIEQAVLSRHPLGEPTNWPGEELGGVHPEKYGNSTNWHAGEPIAFRRSPLLVDVRVPGANDAADPYTLTVAVVHHKSGRFSGYWREAEARGLLDQIGDDIADPERNVVVLGDFNASPSDASVKAYLEAGLTDPFDDFTGSREERISHESGRRIDLVLVSRGLHPEVVPGSAFVLGTAARPNGIDWRTLPTFPGYASDHYPVAIDLIPVESRTGSERP